MTRRDAVLSALSARPKRVVWKYELFPEVDYQVIRVPAGSRVVAVDRYTPTSDGPAVWIEREELPETVDAEIWLVVVGTGHDVPARGAHVGSAWCGPFMWHVYELPVPA